MHNLPLGLGILGAASNADRRGTRMRAMVEDSFAFIWRAVCHLGVSEADAEDAAQQVFLLANRKLDSIAEGSERAFLFGTAVRIAFRFRRTQERRREVSVDQYEESADAAPSPEELIDHARAGALLNDALDAMAPEVRAVFVLFEIEQLRKNEVAAALGIPAGTVASRVRRAREIFQEHVRRFQARAKLRAGDP
jgi:RNA polymerase sigma-70 factor (ECF subfamily)